MIRIKCDTRNKAALKLSNQIRSFLFEEEYGELRGRDGAKEALRKALEELNKIIKP